VQALLARGYDPALPALHGIGYREWVAVVRDGLDPGEALRRMQRDTVRYARRQWTWFEREPGIEWIVVDDGGAGAAAALIEAKARTRGMIE
jgi:tRNA dimethylallyltransferase